MDASSDWILTPPQSQSSSRSRVRVARIYQGDCTCQPARQHSCVNYNPTVTPPHSSLHPQHIDCLEGPPIQDHEPSQASGTLYRPRESSPSNPNTPRLLLSQSLPASNARAVPIPPRDSFQPRDPPAAHTVAPVPSLSARTPVHPRVAPPIAPAAYYREPSYAALLGAEICSDPIQAPTATAHTIQPGWPTRPWAYVYPPVSHVGLSAISVPSCIA